MDHAMRQALTEAGCNNTLADRFDALKKAGETDACLRLLRCHRCELVEALHQAQRPIDVCDWLIHELEQSSRVA